MLTPSSFMAATSIVPVTARPSGVVLKYVVPPVLMWKAPDWIAAIPSWTNCVRQSTRRAFSAPKPIALRGISS